MVSNGPGREETMFMPEFEATMRRMKDSGSHEGLTKARK
jgi:hypothetical protein